MATIDELEEVRVGMTTAELKQLADLRGWDHDVGAGDLVQLTPDGDAVDELVVHMKDGKVAKVQARYDPPSPQRVAAFINQAPRLSRYPEIGMVGWADEAAGRGAIASMDGSQATLVDLAAVDAKEHADFLDMWARQK
jgi:hypothetical protein